MWVKSLNISNLRNIASAEIEPDPCLNCFYGDNGAGKTTLLEALAVLSKGRSFRSGQVASLIGPQGKHFQVVATVENHTGEIHRLGMQRGESSWTARHNGEDVTQLSDLTELLPHVLLEPASHTLVSGPPDGRRKYLDWGVFHVKHNFLTLWRRYNRVLKQRNAALRQSDEPMVESLDPQFIDLGEKMHQARKEHAERLNGLLQEQLALFDRTLGGITLSYRKGWAADRLDEAVEQSKQRDMDRGATGPGPHKADLYLALEGTPAKERLSRGEQKAMTAAMILAQAQLITESGEKPLLLLDDLASEFDHEHLGRVLQAGLELGAQIWLTGTDLEAVIATCDASYKVFHVKHGVIT